jgi:DNA-binding MarR family transcriptional regulator
MSRNIIDLIFELKLSCITREENICEELELSPAEFRGIMAVDPGKAVPCNTLSRKMGLSVSRGSRVINKLMNNGFIKDTGDAGDKRVMKVALTSKGVNTQKRINKSLNDCEKFIHKKLKKSEFEALKNSLEKISEILVSV